MLFGKKKIEKKDILFTATTFTMIENLRLALDVLLGSRVRFKHLQLGPDIDHGHGDIFTNNKEVPVEFLRSARDMIMFKVNDTCYIALFDVPNTARVHIKDHNMVKNPVWYIGTSHVDRREEPFYKTA